jgi:hypothetical protein
VNTVVAHRSAPPLSPQAQERLGQIREVEARIGQRLAAHDLTDEEFWSEIEAVRVAYDAFETSLHAPRDCPVWCNAHSYDASSTRDGEVESTHVHEVRVGAAMLSIAEGHGRAELEVDIHGASGMTLDQVREFSAGLLAACDAVAAR